MLSHYAAELEANGEGKNLQVLEAIVRELKSPFRDPRRPWTPFTPQQVQYRTDRDGYCLH